MKDQKVLFLPMPFLILIQLSFFLHCTACLFTIKNPFILPIQSHNIWYKHIYFTPLQHKFCFSVSFYNQFLNNNNIFNKNLSPGALCHILGIYRYIKCTKWTSENVNLIFLSNSNKFSYISDVLFKSYWI